MSSRKIELSARPLDPDEVLLWEAVTASVSPLKKVSGPLFIQSVNHRDWPSSHRLEPSKRHTTAHDFAQEIKCIPRRKRRNLQIDARLDLHGLTQAEAYALLKSTLARESSKGSSLLLLITGKGSRPNGSDETVGVLRRQAPLWLSTFAEVASTEPARHHHGGNGALYVYLKKH
jgi:DNA-nicking Smr family endonuclease